MVMAARRIVPRLHLITNRHLCGERSLAAVVAAAARGGMGAVQLREKDLPPTDLLPLARELRQALGDTPLLVNGGSVAHVAGCLDLARTVGAAGVHLPGGVGSVPISRATLGPGSLIGRSVHSVAEARVAEAEGADYMILGTIFATASKPGRDPAGLALVAEVAAATTLPIIAIGGITEANVAATLRAGAWGIAVMSTILTAADPAPAVARLRQLIAAHQGGNPMTIAETIAITVNGKDEVVAASLTVANLLVARGITTTLVAVERNGQILRRAEFAETTLAANDKLEIVHFVGGG